MKTRPNILLLFPDQHRGDWLPYPQEVFRSMGMDDLPVRMPNIKKLMESGVTFKNTISPSPLCSPARACLATGLRYAACGVPDNRHNCDLQIPTFYQALRGAGYSVGGVGKFDVHKADQYWGPDGWCDFLDRLGFTEGIDNAGKLDAARSGAEKPADPYMAFLYENGYGKYHSDNMLSRGSSVEPTDLPDELYCDNWIGGNACRMVREFSREKPWFLQVNFAGPHNPWDVTRRMRARWDKVRFPDPNHAEKTDEYDINSVRQNYAAMIENIDRVCGEIIEAVRDRGELENTVIIYSSDHGEMMGDFNLFGKSLPQRGSIQVPLVIGGAGISGGRVDESLVELQDLSSTILDFCGVTEQFTGDSVSLKKTVLEGTPSPRTYQKSALTDNRKSGRLFKHQADWVIYQNHEYKIVYDAKKLVAVYNRAKDVWENDNLLLREDEASVKEAEKAVSVLLSLAGEA